VSLRDIIIRMVRPLRITFLFILVAGCEQPPATPSNVSPETTPKTRISTQQVAPSILPDRKSDDAASTAEELSTALKMLESTRSEVRFDAVRKLKKLGPRAEPAIAALKSALGDDGAPFENAIQFFGPRVRNVASDALIRIGEPAIPALVEALSDENEWIRSIAASTLGQLGPTAKRSFSSLQLQLDEPNQWFGGTSFVQLDRWEKNLMLSCRFSPKFFELMKINMLG
jgi:hypothetical protein